MPGPPPPPPGAPPPPMMAPPVFAASKGSSDDRGALLKSIRQGTKLKKTVTVDKSAPVIPGKVSNNNASSVSSSGNSGNSTSSTPNGVGLGGLFAGGMPKLRPTGKLGGSNLNSSSNNNSNIVRKPEAVTPTKNVNIQNELKKQLAIDSRNRGPPPPAPTRQISEDKHSTKNFNSSNGSQQQQPTTPRIQTAPTLQINHSTLHRKTKSNANLSSLDSPDNVNNSYNPKPVINHGKPNLAPKPPVLNGKPMSLPKKPVMNGKSISRAQSMKSPRSPSPQSPDGGGPMKFGTVRNLSSVIAQNFANSTGNLSTRTRPALNGRPTAPPPSVPPPPPSFLKENPAPPPPLTPKSMVKPPNHAPPPPPNSSLPQPPNHPPPLPPHRTASTLRSPPAIPNNLSAPPPPPRNSSMRENSTPKRVNTDLEQKYKDFFQKPDTFPKPPPFRNVTKTYSNRQAVNKQQAPQPPQHILHQQQHHHQSVNRSWERPTC